MPRNTGLILGTWFNDPNKAYWHFMRMAWPAPTGNLFWTTKPGDTTVLDIGNGDGVITWDGTAIWTPGQFEQGQQDALAVSDITFGNANYTFTDMMRLQTYGCRGVPVDIWYVAFTKFEPHTFIDQTKVFGGVLDRAEAGVGEKGGEVRVSLLSHRNPLTTPFPKRRYSLSWGFTKIPPANVKFAFGIAGTIALPTASKPNVTPGNFVPPPGPTGGLAPGARGPILRVNPRGKPPTATGNVPGHPRPRKVTR